MIVERQGHKLDATIETEVVSLGKIYKSLKDGMSKREDWFNLQSEDNKKAEDLTAKVKKSAPKVKDVECPNDGKMKTSQECDDCQDREGCPEHS